MSYFNKILIYSPNNQTRLLLLSTFIATAFYIFNDGWQQHNDSIKYIKTLNRVESGEGWYHGGIMLRPGAVFISSLIPFFNSENAFGIQNMLFFILISLLMYSYSKRFMDKSLAFYGSVLLISAFPVIFWGLAIMNDMGSWFFLLFSFHLSIIAFENNLEYRDVLLAGLVTGLGILYKTSVVVILLFFSLFLILRIKNKSYIDKSKLIFAFSLLSLLPVTINQIYLWNAEYDVSYWDNFLKPLLAVFIPSLSSDNAVVDSDSESSFRNSPIYYILTFFIAFPLLPLVIWNLRNPDSINLNRRSKEIFSLFSFVTIALIIAYNIYSPRFSFILFPVVIPLTILSIDRIFDSIIKYKNFISKTNLWRVFLLTFLIVNLFVSVKSDNIRSFLGFWPSNI